MRALLVLFFLLSLSSLFSEELRLPTIIIKGKDYSPFPSSPVELSPADLRKEKEEVFLERKLKERGEYFPGGEEEKRVFWRLSVGIGSWESREGNLTGFIKVGKNNGLKLCFEKRKRKSWREEGGEEKEIGYLKLFSPFYSIAFTENYGFLKLPGEENSRYLGERKGKREVIKGRIIFKDGMRWSLSGCNEKLWDWKEYARELWRSEIKNRGDSFQWGIEWLEERMRNYYREDEFSFYFQLQDKLLFTGWIHENKGEIFPQFMLDKKSKNGSFFLALEGGVRRYDLFNLYTQWEGSKIREKFLTPEKIWCLKDGWKNSSYSFLIFYEKRKSLLNWKKKGDLYEPSSLSSATFSGIEIKGEKKLSLKSSLHFSLKAKEEDKRRKIPYHPYFQSLTALRIYNWTLYYNYMGPRYFERGNNQTLKGWGNLGIKWEIERKGIEFSVELANLLNQGWERLKGYPGPGRQFQMRMVVYW